MQQLETFIPKLITIQFVTYHLAVSAFNYAVEYN